MWEDPIVKDVRKAREAHAASLGYDLRAIYQALKEEEASSGHQYVSLAPKRKEKLAGDRTS